MFNMPAGRIASVVLFGCIGMLISAADGGPGASLHMLPATIVAALCGGLLYDWLFRADGDK